MGLTGFAKGLAGGVSEKGLLVVNSLSTADNNKNKLSKIMDFKLGLMGLSESEAVGEIREMPDLATLEVDFNPSSLSISSQKEGAYLNEGVKGANAGLKSISVPGDVVLNLDLLFDDMSIQDAFMLDRLNFLTVGNAEDTVRNISRKVFGDRTGLGKKEHSVRVPIEGIVALIKNTMTRDVMFIWSDMIFAGELSSVNAQYTMFNTSGNPVRGTVSISINQGSGFDKLADGGGSVYWNAAFDKLFGVTDDNLSNNTLVKMNSKLGRMNNLFNL